MRPVNDILGRIFLHIPEHSDFVAAVHDKLVSSTRVAHPPSEMFFFVERFNMGGFIFFIDAPFAAISINVGQFVYKERVLFI